VSLAEPRSQSLSRLLLSLTCALADYVRERQIAT
jgi:hypothetical protein